MSESASYGAFVTPGSERSTRRPLPKPLLLPPRMASEATFVEEVDPRHPSQDIARSMVSFLTYRSASPASTLYGQNCDSGKEQMLKEAEPSPTRGGLRGWPARIVKGYTWSYRRVRSHWPWFLAFVLSSIVCCSIAIGWSFRLSTFNIADQHQMNNASVQLSANLVAIDPVAQQMTLDWQISYDCRDVVCPDVDLYFDANSLRSDSSGNTPSNTKPPPIFSINGDNVLAMSNHTDRRSSSLNFRSEIAVWSANTHRTLQSYPYDKYLAQLVFFAEEAATNSSVSIAIVKTTGIAVGFSVQLQNTSDVSDNFGTVIKNIQVTRGPVVRLYAIFIVVVIWLVTLTFVATCILNVFFGKGISSNVLVLPMGTLFAFTQLRQTLPGAPDGFGAVIDFIGILPCLALLTFCSIFLTAIFLLRNPEKDSARWERGQPGEGGKSHHATV